MLPEIWSEISNKFLFAVKSTIFYFFEVVLEISSAIVVNRQCWMLQMRKDMAGHWGAFFHFYNAIQYANNNHHSIKLNKDFI